MNAQPAIAEPPIKKAEPAPPKRAKPLPMGEAPHDGKAVWLFDRAGERVEAVWRSTRKWDTNGGLWREAGFWARRNSGGMPIPEDFEPAGWLWTTE